MGRDVAIPGLDRLPDVELTHTHVCMICAFWPWRLLPWLVAPAGRAPPCLCLASWWRKGPRPTPGCGAPGGRFWGCLRLGELRMCASRIRPGQVGPARCSPGRKAGGQRRAARVPAACVHRAAVLGACELGGAHGGAAKIWRKCELQLGMLFGAQVRTGSATTHQHAHFPVPPKGKPASERSESVAQVVY